MSRLLRGNFNRLFRNKIFWLCVLAIIAFALNYISQGVTLAEAGWDHIYLDNYYFQTGPFVALFLSVFIPMFIGAEYSFGTIRNKLTIGCTREKLYLSLFLSCLTGVGILLAAWFVSSLAGIPKLGLWRSGISAIIMEFIVTVLYSTALTAIFTFFSMMITGRSISVVVQMVLAIGLILAGSMLYNRLCAPEEIGGLVLINGELVMSEPEPNPMYIGGTLRQIFIALLNILPTGQAILMLNEDTSGSVPIMIPLQIISSILIAFVMTAAGIMLFRKKDLK